jgi:tetratricopeptide (TPR) repeat protein
VDPEVDPSRRDSPKDFARGIAELKKAILTGIPDEGMYYRLGYCYEKLGDLERALDAYRRAAPDGAPEGGGEFACALAYRLGLVLARTGKHAEAAAEFEKALVCPALAAAARNNLGACYRVLHLKRKAVDEFEAAVALDPRMAEAHLNLGVTKAELGRTEAAVESLRRALELDPRLRGAAYSLGIVLGARGDARGAEEALRAAAAAFPDDEKTHLALARLYLDSGRKEEARRAARRAFGLMPVLRAENLDLDTALGGEAPAPAASPAPRREEDEALLERARAAVAGGDRAEAERSYSALLARDPSSAAACLGLAFLSEFSGSERYGAGFPAERCIGYYRRALEAQPRMSTAWFGLGNVYEKIGRYAEAADAFQRAGDLSPEMRFAWYNLGVCYTRLGKREEAEAQFRRALALDPAFADARFQLGEVLASRRDYGGAIEEYEKVIDLVPSHADAHYSLAGIYHREAADPGKAAEHYRAYLELRPRAPDAAEVQGWIEEMEGGG